jgi:hypothetical protein
MAVFLCFVCYFQVAMTDFRLFSDGILKTLPEKINFADLTRFCESRHSFITSSFAASTNQSSESEHQHATDTSGILSA